MSYQCPGHGVKEKWGEVGERDSIDGEFSLNWKRELSPFGFEPLAINIARTGLYLLNKMISPSKILLF